MKKKRTTSKKKIAKRKPAQKRAKISPPAPKASKPIGKVLHFYTALKVAVVKFSKNVSAGSRVRFKGATTDFVQTLDSMQYNHTPIARARKNQGVGIKVKRRVREGDKVYEEK